MRRLVGCNRAALARAVRERSGQYAASCHLISRALAARVSAPAPDLYFRAWSPPRLPNQPSPPTQHTAHVSRPSRCRAKRLSRSYCQRCQRMLAHTYMSASTSMHARARRVRSPPPKRCPSPRLLPPPRVAHAPPSRSVRGARCMAPAEPSSTLPYPAGARVGTTVVGALACAARVRRLDRCQWARHQRFRVGSAAPALRSARHVVRDHLRRHRAERSRLLPDATRRQAVGSGGGRGVCVCWLPRQVYPALQRRRTGYHRVYLHPQ